jgi:saccharopine dehydrogenase-like NADP-dependent oxidoreductase
VRAVLAGLGAVGTRIAHGLADAEGIESLVVVVRDPREAAATLKELEGDIQVRKGDVDDLPGADVTVVAVSHGVRRAAEAALAGGSHVVCVSDDPSDVRALLALDRRARAQKRTVVIGAAMAPGLSCVLAAYLRRDFDRVDELHVASAGTGGPSCARRHHAALAAIAVDWEDGEWRRRSGGSGRELVWFPEPVGGADCYRASLADPLLLVPAFPGCRRVTSRMEATRRDRLTSWLPMLRPPHPEGLTGAVRVEVRGWLDGRVETKILGVAVPPAVAAGAVAARAALWAGEGRLYRHGAAGLAELVDAPGVFLAELAPAGVIVTAFEGGDPQR